MFFPSPRQIALFDIYLHVMCCIKLLLISMRPKFGCLVKTDLGLALATGGLIQLPDPLYKASHCIIMDP